MKEPQKPIADIMLNWTESIRQAVPDNEERCRVYDYIFAECKRIDYGVPHELTKPDGAGCWAIDFIVPYLEERYAGKAAYKQGRQPRAGESVRKQAGANPYARADANNDKPPHTHACGEINNNNKSKNKNGIEIIIPQTPLLYGDDLERELFEIGLAAIYKGKAVCANRLRNLYNDTTMKETLGEVRKVKEYIIACFRTKYNSQSEAREIANLLRAADIGSPDCLEVYGLFVENEICHITCTQKTIDCIEKNKEKFEQAIKSIGASKCEFERVEECD